ncbi:MAG: dephospho-CoA kinase [Lachnospiraceae bacterium]|nr:dephospho-CoA kinase [Lachnospiraceae bacterium]
MRFIGITGGVGSGKTLILNYLRENTNCRVILADDLANELKKPGKPCFKPLVELLGKEILSSDNEIDNKKMSGIVFNNASLLQKVNDIIHPAVKDEILKIRDFEEYYPKTDFLFLEAALLIECGYKNIVDELWYVYVDRDTRIKRLMDSRGYSKEKTLGIMSKQLSDDVFRENCDFIIDNSKTPEYAYEQIRQRLEEYNA